MKDKLIQILTEMLAGRDVELVDIIYVTGGKRPLARIFIDKQGGGITVNECGKIAKEFAVLTHVDETIPEDLIIEVSSPGIDRPIKTAADFRRNTGKNIRVTAPENGKEKDTEGVVKSVSDDKVVLTVVKIGDVSFDIGKIIRAKQVIKF
ncbi:MAG: ribosome maturation factor RimP [Fibrobacteres bacterium]|nr:ribosome maturation factor RimP [Fibrobacterota bacterium]